MCRNASSRAVARGGARLGKPKWVRILTITAGSSIAARRVKGPPHCGQVVMSMAKTRLSNCAQLMRARVETEESSLFPSAMDRHRGGLGKVLVNKRLDPYLVSVSKSPGPIVT